MAGHSQRKHRDHHALEERDDAQLAVDDMRDQLVSGGGAEVSHQRRGDELNADVGPADGGQRPAQVCPTHNRGVEQWEQRPNVAARAGGDERVDDAPLLGWVDGKARRTRLLLDALACAARELAAGRNRAADHRRHLLEGEVEHVVQHEHHALGGRHALEDDQHGKPHALVHCHDVGGVSRGVVRIQKRLREPRPDVCLALHAR